MANFSEQLNAPQGAGARPIAAVQPPTELNTSAGWQNLAGGMLEAFAQYKKQDKIDVSNAIVGEYNAKIASIAQGVEQGTIPPSQARTLVGAHYSKYQAQYPEMVDKFKDSTSNMYEFSSLKKVKEEEKTMAEIRNEKLKGLASEGYPVTESTSDGALQNWIDTRDAAKRIEIFEKKKYESWQRKNTMEAADFDLEQKKLSTQSATALHEMFSGGNKAVMSSAIDIARKYQGNPEAGAQELLNLRNTVGAQLDRFRAANPAAVDHYYKQFEDTFKLANDMLSGKLTGEAQTNALNIQQNQIKLESLQDPSARAMYGAAFISGGPIPSAFIELQGVGKQAVTSIFNTYGVGTQAAKPVVGTDSQRAAFDVLKSSVTDIESGRNANPEKAKGEVSNAVNNILKQIGNGAVNGIPATSYEEAAKLLASPEFLKARSYGLIDPKVLPNAANAIREFYDKRVGKQVSDAIAQVPEGIDATWNGAGVVLGVNLGSDLYLSRETRPKVEQTAQSLQPYGKLLNEAVKAGAHLEGRTDYQKYWEENRHRLIPSIFPEPSKLKVGDVKEFPDGVKRKYNGGNFMDVNKGWEVVGQPEGKDYGMRNDGVTKKGTGYLGELPVPGTNAVATEYSIGVNLNGKEMDIPTIVPTLTDDQKKRLLAAIANNAKPPEDVVRVAVEHAKKRLKEGKSVFAN